MTTEENKKTSSIFEDQGNDKGVPSWLVPY